MAGNLSDFQDLSETRYFGTGTAMIENAEQMLLAQQAVANPKNILLEARTVHSSRDYARLAEPVLLEIQQREQEILEFLSGAFEKRVMS